MVACMWFAKKSQVSQAKRRNPDLQLLFLVCSLLFLVRGGSAPGSTARARDTSEALPPVWFWVRHPIALLACCWGHFVPPAISQMKQQHCTCSADSRCSSELSQHRLG
jgi:hypothetical protein